VAWIKGGLKERLLLVVVELIGLFWRVDVDVGVGGVNVASGLSF
jgi:hypothetical protein